MIPAQGPADDGDYRPILPAAERSIRSAIQRRAMPFGDGLNRPISMATGVGPAVSQDADQAAGLPTPLRFSLRRLLEGVALLAAACAFWPIAGAELTSTYSRYRVARWIVPLVATAIGYCAGRQIFRCAPSFWMGRAMRRTIWASVFILSSLTAYIAWGNVRIWVGDPTSNAWGRGWPYPDAMLLRYAEWINPELPTYWCFNCMVAEVLDHADRHSLVLLVVTSAIAAVLTPQLPYQLRRASVRAIRWYMRW